MGVILNGGPLDGVQVELPDVDGSPARYVELRLPRVRMTERHPPCKVCEEDVYLQNGVWVCEACGHRYPVVRATHVARYVAYTHDGKQFQFSGYVVDKHVK
jgi:ribosomal protein L37AE/L43A